MYFYSPTHGRMGFEEMFQDIMAYIAEEPERKYRLIIGTDSQARDETCFVTAVIIHREGKGARFFYHREYEKFKQGFKQRIFFETAKSLGLASRLAERLSENGFSHPDVEIHLDVGEQGRTKELIREVVGMVTGSGFDARIKPDSFGASTVADKFTK